MKILFLTNEYPPNIYGGAGVHVDHLTRELLQIKVGARHAVSLLDIMCFGDQKESEDNKHLSGISGSADPKFNCLTYKKLLDPLYRNLVMTGSAGHQCDLVHCHTWYTHLAGCLIRQIMGIPLVITAHSLEPHRPWKKEQLGNAYYGTSWLEKTALLNADGVIAVSGAMKSDIVSLYDIDPDKVRVIYNGIDIDRYQKTKNPEVLRRYGINPQKPYVLFVGRITRQKGIIHLVEAIPMIQPGIQVVLCAGAPDTDEIAAEMTHKVNDAKANTPTDIIWINRLVPETDLIPIYSHASIFVCPSVYEPFGIINLEAMACQTPVVATATGGIKEAVEDGVTGFLVPFESYANSNTPGPKDPKKFSMDLANAINGLLKSPEKIHQMGSAARGRVETLFSWKSIARQTLEFYTELIETTEVRG